MTGTSDRCTVTLAGYILVEHDVQVVSLGNGANHVLDIRVLYVKGGHDLQLGIQGFFVRPVLPQQRPFARSRERQ